MYGLTICKTDKPFTCGGAKEVVETRIVEDYYREMRVDIVQRHFGLAYKFYMLEKTRPAEEVWEGEGGLVR